MNCSLKVNRSGYIAKPAGFVCFDGKKATLMLSVTLPSEPVYMQIYYNLGKPKSILRLCFKEKIDVVYFRKVYMWIYNLMVFVNFRKNIKTGEINLGKTNDEGKIVSVAYTYINELNKEDIADIDQIIGYYFVFDHINDLIQIVNKEDLNLLFIPKNIKSGRCVMPELYMVCCTSFESVLTLCFQMQKHNIL